MRVYGYCRVSTGLQGESLEVQAAQIRAAAGLKGLEMTAVLEEESVSGSVALRKRPKGGKLLAELEPGDWIIVSKLDRLFRSVRDAVAVLGELRDRGVHLYVGDLGGDVTGNGVASLVFTIMAAVAEFERERIRERTADQRGKARAEGRVLGRTPFGWRAREDGVLVREPEEQRAISLMMECRAKGWTLRRIQAEVAQMFGLRVSVAGIPWILARAAGDPARQGTATPSGGLPA